MTSDRPYMLDALLHGTTAAERDAGWDWFVEQHSRLLLHTVRHAASGSRDDAMDRYAYVLEQLRANECRRLRTWADDGRSRLSTWLVVVARRLCADFQRQRYGRTRPDAVSAAQQARRFLADLVAEELREDVTSDPAEWTGAEQSPCVGELHERLADALDSLDAADRLLLALRFRDALPAARIAPILSLPSPFHVYRRLNHVLAHLRRELESRGIEDAVP
jgi:RNA polymerase sigma factor (sigma-70 family)